MALPRTCPHCGSQLPEDAPEEFCSVCAGLTVARNDPDAQPTRRLSRSEASPPPRARELNPGELHRLKAALAIPDRVGDYALLEELAHGGMGIIYKARQISLDRVVALKMILRGPRASADDLQRFQTEALAAAQLQHSGIVAIHDVGEIDGQPFYSMDYVAGRSLAQVARETPLAPQKSARYVQQVADAIHYAHQRGILHRDLKPSNVLIDEHDQPRVTDFGLAKILAHDTGDTLSGTVMGSPSYMPPEQAQGKRREVTARSDVYSLGALLYDLLCGRPPFRSETSVETLRQVLEMEPVPPRALNPRTPRDLETIVLKCLQKNPAQRYASAHDLADELGRFQRDEPIIARPVGPSEKAWRWCRRHPAVASLSAAIVFLLVAVAIGSSGFAYRLKHEKDRTEQAREDAVAKGKDAIEKLRASLSAEAQARRWSGRPGRRFDSLIAISNAAAIRPSRELRNEAIACLALADVRRLRELHLPTNANGISFDAAGDRYVLDDKQGTLTVRRSLDDQTIAILPGPGVPFPVVRFCRDNDRLAAKYSHQSTNLLLVWDLKTTNVIFSSPSGASLEAFDLDPVGERLAVGHRDGRVRVYDLKNGEGKSVGKDVPAPRIARFDPSATTLAVSGSNSPIVLLFNLTNQAADRVCEHDRPVRNLAWSHDGRFVAVACEDRRVHVWTAQTGERHVLLEGHEGAVSEVFFNHTGDVLLSRDQRGNTCFWNPWEAVLLLGAPGNGKGFSADDARCPYFAPSGPGVWEFAAGHECRFLSKEQVRGLPDGDETKRLLHVSAPVPAVARRAVYGKSSSADGRFAVTFKRDDVFYVVSYIDSTTGRTNRFTSVRGETRFAFSPDSRWFALANEGRFRVWKLPGWEVSCVILPEPGAFPPAALAFTPDGTALAIGASASAVRLLEPATGRHLATLEPPLPRILWKIEFSADGSHMAVLHEVGSGHVWDLHAIRARLATMGLDWETVAPPALTLGKQ